MPFLKDLKVERVEGELAVALSKSYPVHKGFAKIGEKKWFLPYKYVEQGDKVLNFETRPDDTWIITYPRSVRILMRFPHFQSMLAAERREKQYHLCLSSDGSKEGTVA
ncbi:hypothetical protein EAG_05238 [Camponotus floridanus]|uniref:Uncharacterized protein n=1 Tax=Camponotus floridanus TaxID=104421 RepID=E2A2R7_CAMFO|nr:hypothetical protein EAG_05238 [Camponotus floridanus]